MHHGSRSTPDISILNSFCEAIFGFEFRIQSLELYRKKLVSIMFFAPKNLDLQQSFRKHNCSLEKNENLIL